MPPLKGNDLREGLATIENMDPVLPQRDSEYTKFRASRGTASSCIVAATGSAGCPKREVIVRDARFPSAVIWANIASLNLTLCNALISLKRCYPVQIERDLCSYSAAGVK